MSVISRFVFAIYEPKARWKMENPPPPSQNCFSLDYTFRFYLKKYEA
jgi:hypothetical protein